MNKYQETLEFLRSEDVTARGNDKFELLYFHLDNIEELVDKATPKKRDMMRIKKYDGYNIGICKCGQTLDTSMGDEINYCPKCGQRILWE